MVVTGVLFTVGCGRIGFDSRPPFDGVSTTPIEWVKSAVTLDDTVRSPTEVFSVTAAHAGDALVFAFSCEAAAVPSMASVTAPGWTITALGPITGSVATGYWVGSVGTIAPDTMPATFTVTWLVIGDCTTQIVLGDELTNTDPTGGTTTFDAHNEVASTGICSATVITGNDDDAVWASCNTRLGVTATGPGYTKASDDGIGDWTAYKITSDPGGTAETATFTTTGLFVETVVSIKPR